MKKNKLLILIVLLTSIKSYSCSCDETNPALEFYASKYVFTGAIISKEYAKDSLTYTVTFKVSKHYKKSNSPDKLKFTLASEGKYTGRWTSCDWNADLYEQWLVYAYMYKGKLRFSGMCSNSKLLGRVRPREQKMLDNGNSFEIDNYIFEDESEFNYCENITDINSILKSGKVKEYKNPTALLNLFIDSNGNLTSVNGQKGLIRKKDSIFGLTNKIEYRNSQPITEFEKEAIKLISQVKKWEIKKHRETNFSVPYIRHIWVSYDLKTSKWSYEL